ncbi:MAG: hypothetical protein QF419_01690 [Acidimicrobiales bacterium]|nr:hypothetical protein [Acidimicrobiales bacterium]
MSTSTYALETPRIRARGGKCLIKPLRDGFDWLHFLDYDSLHCTGCPSITQIDRAYDAYKDLGIGKTDLIYGACNHNPSRNNRVRVRTAWHLLERWAPARVRLTTGIKGADYVLIDDIFDLLRVGNVANRFTDVVIGSGHHIFAGAVLQLRKAGLRVHLVVASPQSLSLDLARAANGCVWLLHERRCLRHQEPVGKQALAA